MAEKLTTKNLEQLSELLDFEDLMYKKCLFYSTQATDQTLKTKFGSYANKHKQRFQNLLNYLNSHE